LDSASRARQETGRRRRRHDDRNRYPALATVSATRSAGGGFWVLNEMPSRGPSVRNVRREGPRVVTALRPRGKEGQRRDRQLPVRGHAVRISIPPMDRDARRRRSGKEATATEDQRFTTNASGDGERAPAISRFSRD